MEVIRDSRAAFPAGAYTPALKFGDFVMISGQGPLDSQGKVQSGSIEEETRLTLTNVKRLLEAAGATMDQVVKCTCYLADINDWAVFNKVYAEFFGIVKPCRTTVQAGLGKIKVEIDAMAYMGK